MPILRLAYITLFLIALFTVFTLWSQVGGQGHLDLVPWFLKLVLGVSAAFAIVRAASAARAAEIRTSRTTPPSLRSRLRHPACRLAHDTLNRMRKLVLLFCLAPPQVYA